MLPQFVDFNADGFVDIVTGTYDGMAHVSMGNANGFTTPTYILDRDEKRIGLGQGMHDARGWSGSGGHGISAVAFDWDADGDHDLLLGDYEKGHVILRVNEGSNAEPAFSTSNTNVMVGDEPLAVPGGVSAIHLVDWDGDGLTDLLTGGMKKGGVYVYRNVGTVGKPAFAPADVLMKAEEMPNAKGEPNNGCYAFAHDVDEDGDLDLLVGGYSTWNPDREPLTAKQEQRLAEAHAQLEEISQSMDKMFESVEQETDSQKQEELITELFESEEYQKMMEESQSLWTEVMELEGQPKREAGIWLYRQK